MNSADGAESARVLWLTGLSGAGKSTIARCLEERLRARGQRVALLDGDEVRQGLNKDLGFSAADRAESVRRVGEVSRLMVAAELTVIVALISPFRADRDAARALFKPGQFVEVFVDTPLAVAEARDPKGLYRRARQGQLLGFTGVDSPYEVPLRAEITINTQTTTAEQAACRLLEIIAP
jgi:adenylyl-sulfate kinase